MKFLRQLRSLSRKGKLEAEMAEEMQHHVELQAELNVKAGMNHDEARYAALRQFGNVASIQEQARDARGWVWVEQAWRNLRFATRALGKARTYSVTVAVTLALGIGVNTTIFSLVEALMLRRLPVSDPEQLVVVEPQLSYDIFDHFRQEAHSLSGIIAIGHTRERRMTNDGSNEATSVKVQEVSGDYFRVLGVGTQLGRTLNSDDDRANEPRLVAVLSDRGWRRLLGADANAIGRVIRINNVPVSVIGVAEKNFAGIDVGEGQTVDLWCPLWLKTQLDSGYDADRLTTKANGSFWLSVVGRLGPGISSSNAQAELEYIFRRQLAAVVPASLAAKQRHDFIDRPFGLKDGTTGYSTLRHSLKQSLAVLWGVAGLVLLIACVNAAGLIHVRGLSRRREMAVRMALGAGRSRLILEMMTENLVLGFAGCGLGLMVSLWGAPQLQNLLGAGHLASELNLPVLLFAGVLTLVSMLGCGIAPALWISRTNAGAALKDNANPGSQRFSYALIIAQVAISFVLLSGAGLMLLTLQVLSSQTLGFVREERVQFAVEMKPNIEPAKRAEIYRRFIAAIEVLPGVKNATLVQGGLLARVSIGDYFLPETLSAPIEWPIALFRLGGHDYFAARGIALMRGRDFTEQDERAGAPGVAVISEMIARKYFNERDPIGSRLMRSEQSFEIIGVAADVRDDNIRAQSAMTVYLPFLQQPKHWGINTDFCVKIAGAPAQFLPAFQKELRGIEASAEVINYDTLRDIFDQRLAKERAIAGISSLFSVLALVLSAIGLYGVLSYRVEQRTKEIGIRMALGAQISDVLRTVLGQGLVVLLIGCALGFVGALMTGRVLASLLYGITPLDFMTFFVTGALLLTIGLFASWLPARRAARVDPMVALRTE